MNEYILALQAADEACMLTLKYGQDELEKKGVTKGATEAAIKLKAELDGYIASLSAEDKKVLKTKEENLDVSYKEEAKTIPVAKNNNTTRGASPPAK